MIIYLRLIENYLISSMLTSPPWGNDESKWEKSMGVMAKMEVNYVTFRIFSSLIDQPQDMNKQIRAVTRWIGWIGWICWIG